MGLCHRMDRGARVRERYLPRLFSHTELLKHFIDGFGRGAAAGERQQSIGRLFQADRNGIEGFGGQR